LDESPAVHERAAKEVRGLDLLIGVPIIWAAQLVLGVLTVLWLGMPSALEDHPFTVLGVTLAGGAVTVLVSWFLVCRKYRKSFTDGFLITRPSKKTLMYGIAVGIGLAIGGSILVTLFATGEHPFTQMAESLSGLISIALIALLLPPVEELYYRGFIFPVIERKFGGLPAILIVIIWFAAAHLAQSLDDWIAIPVTCALGAVLTIQRRITGSLTMPLVTHWTYNLCLVIATLVQVGSE